MTNDGIALTSAAHPIPVWWKRIYWWFRGLRGIKRSSLETTEIQIAGIPMCPDCGYFHYPREVHGLDTVPPVMVTEAELLAEFDKRKPLG